MPTEALFTRECASVERVLARASRDFLKVACIQYSIDYPQSGPDYMSRAAASVWAGPVVM